ncbi:MAG: FAD-dependent oxidoreductase, partial [Eggerthellaceae bacterium]|nr:FAD-dependent oxidoreductase [Eggerthellaceae bacterium]
VLVSGTSMVGLKALEACLDQGVSVTLLGRSSHIMRGAAHPTIAGRFEELLAKRGVALRLSQAVDNVEVVQAPQDASSALDDAGASTSCAITFSTGDTERFDEVILAQGVKPNLDFVAVCNFALDIDRGLAVDRFMRTDLPDVYAAGDVARALDLQTGARRIIGLWQNAVQQGRCAGRAIAAELASLALSHPFPGSIPANTIHVRDILFASAGSMDGGPRADGESVRFEVSESHDTMRMLAYRTVGCAEQLVGFNILSVLSESDRHDELNCEIGKYRREILNSLL